MHSFQAVIIPGTYRSRCCRTEVSVPADAALPVCLSCQQRTEWALVVSRRTRVTPRPDQLYFYPVAGERR